MSPSQKGFSFAVGAHFNKAHPPLFLKFTFYLQFCFRKKGKIFCIFSSDQQQANAPLQKKKISPSSVESATAQAVFS